MPVTGAGNGVAAPATPTAFGTVIPSADPTDAPVGHCAAAVDAVGVGAVAVGVDATAVGVDPWDEPPQATNGAAKASVIKGIQREWLRVTGRASEYNPGSRASHRAL
jgi:hypothetical protein